MGWFCQLQIGTYQEQCQWVNSKGICRLPLWRLNPMLLELFIFSTPWASSGWSEALCAPGNLGGQVYIDSLAVLRNRFYYLSPGTSSYLEVKWSEVNSLSRVWLFATPWTVAHWAPPSMWFSRQEYCSGLPFPSPGDLPGAGIEPGSPALYADALPSNQGSPFMVTSDPHD